MATSSSSGPAASSSAAVELSSPLLGSGSEPRPSFGVDDRKASNAAPDDEAILDFSDVQFAGWSATERDAIIQVVKQVDRHNVGLWQLKDLQPVMTPAFYHILGLRENAKPHEEDALEKQVHELAISGPIETSKLLWWVNARLKTTLEGVVSRPLADAEGVFNRVANGNDAPVSELVAKLSELPKLLKSLGIGQGDSEEAQSEEVARRLEEKFGSAQTIGKADWMAWATIQIRLQQSPIADAVAKSAWAASLPARGSGGNGAPKKKKLAAEDRAGQSSAPPSSDEDDDAKKKKKESKMCRGCCL